MRLSPKKTALVVGLFFGGQSFLDAILDLHLVSVHLLVHFAWGKAFLGIVYHGIAGLVLGWVFVLV